MPRAAGLFHQAIAQSVPSPFFSAPLAADITAAIAGELGMHATRAELADVDPLRLAAAGDAVNLTMHRYGDRWGPAAQAASPYAPVVDGDVLPATPWHALAAAAARDVPPIAGHTRDECRLLLAMAGQLGTIDDGQAAQALRTLTPGPNGEQAHRAAYPELTAEGLYEPVQTDSLFRMPTLNLAQAQTAGGGLAHLYELTWAAPANAGILGACHGLDGPLTFGNLTDGFADRLIGSPTPPEAENVSAQFRTASTRSATTGDPDRPTHHPQHRLTRVFDTPPTVTTHPEETSRHLWENHGSPPALSLAAT